MKRENLKEKLYGGEGSARPPIIKRSFQDKVPTKVRIWVDSNMEDVQDEVWEPEEMCCKQILQVIER